MNLTITQAERRTKQKLKQALEPVVGDIIAAIQNAEEVLKPLEAQAASITQLTTDIQKKIAKRTQEIQDYDRVIGQLKQVSEVPLIQGIIVFLEASKAAVVAVIAADTLRLVAIAPTTLTANLNPSALAAFAALQVGRGIADQAEDFTLKLLYALE